MHKIKNKKSKIFLLLIIFASIFGFIRSSHAGNKALAILNIAGTGDYNRIKYAYPGIEYKVKIGVEGGDFPYTYSLINPPSGMFIDSSSGIITWTPLTEGPYTVNVRVIDSSNATVAASYPLAVNKTSFIFIDSINGNNFFPGDGTIENPYQTLDKVWDLNVGPTKFIYFRTGTYNIPYNGDGNRSGACLAEGSSWYRLTIDAASPHVFMGYPGETAVLEGWNGSGAWPSAPGGGAHFFLSSPSSSDAWFSNLTVNKIFGCVFELSDADYFTAFEITTGSGYSCSESENYSVFMYQNEGPSINNVISNCNLSGDDHVGSNWSGCKMYHPYHLLMEDNLFSGYFAEAVSFKADANYCTFRHNEINGSNLGIVVQSMNNTTSTYNEICFNYVHNCNEVFDQGEDGGSSYEYIYRNTFQGGNAISRIDGRPFHFRGQGSDNNPHYLNNNVIVSDYTCGSGCTDHVWLQWSTGFAPTFSGNLSGKDDGSIIDLNGNLTESYESYIGTRGWQISSSLGETNLPAIPSGLNIS